MELEQLTGALIGAGITVHRALGPGFLESIYEEALAVELAALGLPFSRQCPIVIRYRGVAVGRHRLDFLVDGRLVVELKATSEVSTRHLVVVRSYLGGAQLQHGLLMYFGSARLVPRRVFRGARSGD